MSKRPLPILHVDGSLTEYIDKRGVLHSVAGLGGYLVVEGKIVNRFSKKLKNEPFLNHHEEYAVLEGMRWVKNQGYSTLRIKTDSMYSVNLFNNQKKTLFKTDKFFLMQYMLLEYMFDWVEVLYHERADNDLSHNLSRTYLDSLPLDVEKLHNTHNRKKSQYKIEEDASHRGDDYIKAFLGKRIHACVNSLNKI